MVSFAGVKKSYGSQEIFKDLTFDIADGEFVFLIGRSGAGKTTLMRLLTRQVIADAGTIRVGAFDLSSIKQREILTLRRMVGVIYQDYKLLSERTVAENIALGLEIIGKSRAESESRVHDLLQLIGLAEKGSVFPSQLSGGEAQRVCIARALATAPTMLFADEPTGNLDEATAQSIVRLLAKINSLGTTILMATHNQSLVETLDKRVLELRDGAAHEIRPSTAQSTSDPVDTPEKEPSV